LVCSEKVQANAFMQFNELFQQRIVGILRGIRSNFETYRGSHEQAEQQSASHPVHPSDTENMRQVIQ
jgi:hypothetical protein